MACGSRMSQDEMQKFFEFWTKDCKEQGEYLAYIDDAIDKLDRRDLETSFTVWAQLTDKEYPFVHAFVAKDERVAKALDDFIKEHGSKFSATLKFDCCPTPKPFL